MMNGISEKARQRREELDRRHEAEGYVSLRQLWEMLPPRWASFQSFNVYETKRLPFEVRLLKTQNTKPIRHVKITDAQGYLNEEWRLWRAGKYEKRGVSKALKDKRANEWRQVANGRDKGEYVTRRYIIKNMPWMKPMATIYRLNCGQINIPHITYGKYFYYLKADVDEYIAPRRRYREIITPKA